MNTWYCDGSTYKNGQKGQDSSYCVVCPSGMVIREHIGDYSINVAELSAILHAVTLADPNDLICTDSNICVNWVKNWKPTKNNRHVRRDVSLIKSIVEKKKLNLLWVPRDKNMAGIEIENEPFYR